ncbi:hypothetical protein [Desulfuromonas acetoxidans]|uniref:hypothetical protein n=1 Tax=Desulfuromonas acetoxidans TaxID=891 RepID=UPI002931F298|nr:hypothetical protein [Desulfuromonas acetoxidans]
MGSKSVWFSDEALKILAVPENIKGAFSSRNTTIIKGYAAMVAEAMPTLAEKEWLLIMDMLNGTVLDEKGPENLGQDIAECSAEDGLGSKWDCGSGLDLARRVDAMPLSAKFAIQEVAYRFWSETGIVKNYREKLESCGAKIK